MCSTHYILTLTVLALIQTGSPGCCVGKPHIHYVDFHSFPETRGRDPLISEHLEGWVVHGVRNRRLMGIFDGVIHY